MRQGLPVRGTVWAEVRYLCSIGLSRLPSACGEQTRRFFDHWRAQRRRWNQGLARLAQDKPCEKTSYRHPLLTEDMTFVQND